jgi:hypothetical protein
MCLRPTKVERPAGLKLPVCLEQGGLASASQQSRCYGSTAILTISIRLIKLDNEAAQGLTCAKELHNPRATVVTVRVLLQVLSEHGRTAWRWQVADMYIGHLFFYI